MSIKAFRAKQIQEKLKWIDHDYAILKNGDYSREVQDQLAGIIELEADLLKEIEAGDYDYIYRDTLSSFIGTNRKKLEGQLAVFGVAGIRTIMGFGKAVWEEMRDARDTD